MICEPIDTYGLAKLMVTLYAKKLGFNSLRLFAVYGEGGRTFKDVVNKPDAKYSHPENVKDFVHVDIVCHAVERLIHAKHLYGEIINVSRYDQEEAYTMVLGTGGDVNRFYQYPQRQYECSYWVGDNTKMKKLLNIKYLK